MDRVFLAEISMGPVFSTALASVGDAFPHVSGTALCFVITRGRSRRNFAHHRRDRRWRSEKRLKSALLVIPTSAASMVVLDVAMRNALR